MGLLASFRGWLRGRADRRRAIDAASKVDDRHVALDVLKYLSTHPAALEVSLDTPHGRAVFTRGDVPRLESVVKAYGNRSRPQIGERLFAHSMQGGSAYGFPGGWSSDRLESVLHMKAWTFIAIRAIWSRLARLPPHAGFVTERLGPAGQTTPYSPQQRALDFHWHRKSLHAVKPHETVTPAPAHHPLCTLLANPNKFDVSYDLWYELGMFLELTGNAYLWAVPSNLGLLDGSLKAAELWVLPSHWVWPRVGKDHLIEHYEVRPWIGPGMLRFPASDVIHVRFKSPIHKIDGYSPLTAGAEWIDTSESVNRSRFFQFKNGCFPLGNLKLGDRYVDLDDEDLERLYAKLYGRFQGEANYGRPIITPPDSEYVPLTINPTEMAYVGSSDQLRDMILSLWAVPHEIAGITDAGSEVAMYGPMRQFAENCLIPRVTLLGQVMTERLARRWDKRLRLWWPDPTPDDPAQKRENLLALHQMEAVTPNEARMELLGWAPLPGGDEVKRQSQGGGGATPPPGQADNGAVPGAPPTAPARPPVRPAPQAPRPAAGQSRLRRPAAGQTASGNGRNGHV